MTPLFFTYSQSQAQTVGGTALGAFGAADNGVPSTLSAPSILFPDMEGREARGEMRRLPLVPPPPRSRHRCWMKHSQSYFSNLNLLTSKQISLLLHVCLFVSASLLFHSQPPCQMRCDIYEVSSTRGILVDLDNLPIKGARLIVREASPKAHGPEAICRTRFGHVVLKTKTNKKGYFDLQGLEVGLYWVTYMDPKEGESFLVQVTSLEGDRRFELGVNHWSGSLCYAVDVERNKRRSPLARPNQWIRTK